MLSWICQTNTLQFSRRQLRRSSQSRFGLVLSADRHSELEVISAALGLID